MVIGFTLQVGDGIQTMSEETVETVRSEVRCAMIMDWN